jgi:hypothetical protein
LQQQQATSSAFNNPCGSLIAQTQQKHSMHLVLAAAAAGCQQQQPGL